MKVKELSYFQRKLRNLFWVFFHKLENNNNAEFSKNGEENFINSFFEYYTNKEAVIFDIGANIGKYAEVLLQKSNINNVQAFIHLFEPTNKCYSILKGKFDAQKNIQLNKSGISEKEGKMDIFFEKEGSTLASLYKRNLGHLNIEMQQKEQIDLVRLDNYIEQKQIKHIHLLKIDIEGHDLSGLRSLGNYLNYGFIDFIQFEYGGTNLDARTTLLDFYVLLENAGFKVCKIKPRKLEPRKYESFMENFNYANYVAISKSVATLI